MMIWPSKLFPYYPHPIQVSLLSWEYASAAALVIAASVASVALIRRNRLFAALWGYYVVTLIPVLGLVQVGVQAMADRFTYLPSLAPFLLTGLAAAWVLDRIDSLQQGRSLLLACFAAAMVLFVVALSSLTVKQIAIWKDCNVLWSYVIEEGKVASSIAYNNRGVCRESAGSSDAAAEDYGRALLLNPRDDQAYYNLGNIYYKSGMTDQAIDLYTKSININAKRANAFYNRGVSYTIKNQQREALADLNKAIELKQDFDMAYFSRGQLFARYGERSSARADYQKACSLGYQAACGELTGLGPPSGHVISR
jgi:tetratricopeptide (TPR) repeat protein